MARLGRSQPFLPKLTRLPVPAAATNTYTITPSGSVVFSGTAANIRTRTQIPSGSVVFSGAAGFIRTRTQIPTGLIQFSGTIPQIHTRLSIPAGNVTFSGSSALIFIPAGGGPAGPGERLNISLSRHMGL